MKLNFSLKNQEANLEADIEKLVEKQLDYNARRPQKKTRYQIKQEEKRKNEEQKHKQDMQKIYLLFGIVGVCVLVALIASLFGI